MPGANTPITNKEKSALFALKFGILPDWETAFIVADDRPEAQVITLKGLKSRVSNWKNSDKVRIYLEYIDRIISDKYEDARLKGREDERKKTQEERQEENKTSAESERTEPQQRKAVAKLDYYDPKNQRQTINAIIDRSQGDPKTQLDAIKAIQQTQRDDRQAAKDNKIQRFFTPINCKSCPLMEKERERLRRKEAKG